MTQEIDHARCSELLRDYLNKQLDTAETEAVDAHLAVCAACTEELAGVRALVAPVAGLNPGERDRLRRAVGGEIATRSRRVVELPEARPANPWRSRAAPVLGAAAIVLLLAAAAVVTPRIFGGSDDAGDAGRGTADSAAPVAEGPRPVFDGSGPEAVMAQGERGEEAAADDDAATESEADSDGAGSGRAGKARRDGLPQGRITRADLQGLGAKGHPFTAFAGEYEAPVDPALQESFVEELAGAAPEELGDQLRECAAEVLAGNRRALPAYAAERSFRNQDVLVLGFATASAVDGPIDGFLFFVWPTGSCGIPSTSIGGRTTP